MKKATRRYRAHRGLGTGARRVIVALLTIGAAVSMADEGRLQDKPVSAVRPQVSRVPGQAVRQVPATQPTSRPSSGCGSKTTTPAPTPSPNGPHPRWVVKEPKVTAEPVWRGRKAEFVFEVANEGEADLRIRLKGK